MLQVGSRLTGHERDRETYIGQAGLRQVQWVGLLGARLQQRPMERATFCVLLLLCIADLFGLTVADGGILFGSFVR